MSFYAVPSTYNALLGAEDIPATMLPTTQSKMIPCASQLKSVRTQSASLTPGSLALWQIQTGAGTGFLKSGSAYLRGTLTLSMAAAAGTWRFSGPREGLVGEGEGLNKGTHSASALLSRLTVSNGAQQLSQLTNYNVWHDLLVTHATSSDFCVNDETLYEFLGVTRGVGAAPTLNERTINFAIPLMSPLFNGQQSIPLFLLNSPLSVEILFNSIADSFVVTGAGASVTDYVISNAEIVYEEIAVSPELKQSIMARLQGGAMWKQFLDSVYSIQTTADQNSSYNIGVGVTSCKGVIGVDRNPSAIGVGFTGDHMLNGFSNIRVQYDGKLINNYDITTDASAFAELNRALHSMYDSNITSCLSKDASAAAGNNGWSDYVVSKFAWGVSSQAVNDATVGFSGSPVQMITVQHFNNTSPANNNQQNFPYVNEGFVAARQRVYFVVYDEMLTIDGNGICSLIR